MTATMTYSDHARLLVSLCTLACLPIDASAQPSREADNPTAAPRLADARKNAITYPPAQPPFHLSTAELAQVDRILQAWELKTTNIQKFTCDFQRFEYQPQWSGNKPHSVSEGVVHFKAPDRAEFHVMRRHDAQGNIESGEHLEHWICDGTRIFEFDSRQKLLREQRLPREWQGKAITNGPLPFLFGAEADKIKARYWVRQIKATRPGEIWLQIYPKTKQDAANYRRVDVMLSWANQDDDFLPNGMRVYRLGNNYENFVFSNRKINERSILLGKWWDRGRYRPRTPSGWKRIVDGSASSDNNSTTTNRIGQPANNKIVR